MFWQTFFIGRFAKADMERVIFWFSRLLASLLCFTVGIYAKQFHSPGEMMTGQLVHLFIWIWLFTCAGYLIYAYFMLILGLFGFYSTEGGAG